MDPIDQKQEREKWMNDDLVTDFMEDSFKKLEATEKKNIDPTKKPIPKYLEGLFNKNKEKNQERPKNANELKEEKEIKQYMKEYDIEHHREKSLMDLHKVNFTPLFFYFFVGKNAK